MEKALTPKHPLENDYFADDTVKDAEETDIPLSQCPSEDDHSATCYLLSALICWEAVNKNSNNSLKD